MSQLITPEKITLLNHPEMTERRIQERLAAEPHILGLGELIMRDMERPQPAAGRLDLLFQHSETNKRYEVELQLGKMDESHLIRTIEYWDIERKRYPQYEHCAVIIAEDITSRFLNVVSLFNGMIPLVAIQMNAYKMGDDTILTFTKVIDELTRGLVDDDEEIREPTDRKYWLSKGTKETLAIADETLNLVNSLKEGGYALNYNKFYIGLTKNGAVNNFVRFRPQKRYMLLEFRHPKDDNIDQLIENHELDDNGYDARSSRYRLRISTKEIQHKHDVFKQLIAHAEHYVNG